MNTNFNLEKELAEQSDKDWHFGALSQPGMVSIPLSEREKYLPIGETQYDQFTDFTDCASRSPVNHMEALFTYHYEHGMKGENKKWLNEKGYVQNGKVTFSDRYIAVLSGTTKQGNSLKAPLETIRTQGLIPKSLLPKTDTLTWEEYYAPIPQALKNLGQEFRKRFTLNYEQVPSVQFGEVLKDDCIGVAAYAWMKPVNGVYQKIDASLGYNHAFLLYAVPKFQAFDNYFDFTDGGVQVEGDFTKNLASDYEFYQYGYRMYLSEEHAPRHYFLKNLSLNANDPEVSYLQDALVSLGYPIPHAVTNYFGGETRHALEAFQISQKIKDDGSHFGPLTRMALNKILSPQMGVLDSFVLAVRAFLGV